ncbi:RNA polymerase sigma factor [Paenibacillus agaridevorans]|nr:sigma-70 family RNA polymerase sigma factor [Paenibacillus agaridevorans]
MSRAQDNGPVYPGEQATNQSFEEAYRQYRPAIRNYLAMKVHPMKVDDLLQYIFLRAMERRHTFKGNSSLFTWIFKIAQNVIKNEYRSSSRNKEQSVDMETCAGHLIGLDYARHVDIRIDIGSALEKLDERDRHMISLRFFVGCTLAEIAVITGMRESAVKNRLYRGLQKLRKELKEWGDIAVRTIQDMVDIVDANGNAANSEEMEHVYRDLFGKLKGSVEELVKKFKHRPSEKVVIEIYPDLPAFHQATGEPGAPDWFMGTFEGNTLKIVSPLNPGPAHSYHSILQSTVHLYAMWLVKDINASAPKWICQGVGGYESKQMSPDFIIDSVKDTIVRGIVPTFRELNEDSFRFEEMKGFQFTYLIVQFIVERYGMDALNRLVRDAEQFNEALGCSESELHGQWVTHLKKAAS